MDENKKKKLEDRGWEEVSARDFLDLTNEENEMVEEKVANTLDDLKKELGFTDEYMEEYDKKQLEWIESIPRKASDALDWLFAQRVLGWTIEQVPEDIKYLYMQNATVFTGEEYYVDGNGGSWKWVPDFSSDEALSADLLKHFSETGGCPSLHFDDDGHWALAFSGTQPIHPIDDPDMAYFTSWIEPYLWCDTIPLAICVGALIAEGPPDED